MANSSLAVTRRELLRQVDGGGPALRSSSRSGSGDLSFGSTPPTAPVGVVVLNRMAFGPRPGDLSEVGLLGFDAYLDQQLSPLEIDDSATEQRIFDAGFTTLEKPLAQLWEEHQVAGEEDPALQQLPYQETVRATLLRQVHSERQLFEVMVDFWHNHFSVYGPSVAAVFPHLDRDVIRPNALGNFLTLLEMVSQSTAILFYLDNFTNSDAGPNENFARELFELHTLGAENYLGLVTQDEVPVDADGNPTGYVDEDVYEATRCFTGWTVAFDPDDPNQPEPGTFYYRDEWHDRFQKRVLKATLPSDQPPLEDGLQVLELLATNPGTARHIARKLCRRLIADEPPESVVAAAADTFSVNLEAPNQLELVVRTILESPEFTSTWGEKVKRPQEILASTCRAIEVDLTFSIGDPGTDSVLLALGATGHAPFAHPAPNGYSDLKEAWQSTSPRAMSWRMVNSLIGAIDPGTGAYVVDLLAQTPPAARTSNELVDFWSDRVLGRALSTQDRSQVVEFMAQGFNPNLDLPLDTDPDLQSRLQSMVGLLLMTPDFLWR